MTSQKRSKKSRSYRKRPVHRSLLATLFRISPKRYRAWRRMLSPLLSLLGIEQRRKPVKTAQYKSTAQRHAEPATLAEKHAAQYRNPSAETAPRFSPYVPPSARTAPVSRGGNRQFNDARPVSGGKQSKTQHQSHGNQRLQPSPKPTGPAPYHLALGEILPPEQMDAIQKAGRLLFHMAGDTGGVKSPESQHLVSMGMESQFEFQDVALRPAFFYHLGDVVYFFGERKEYYSQFYDPYTHYPGPIFAIPGNHDGDVTDGGEASLAAFVDNFCAPKPHLMPEAGEANRDAMTQPNVYWTLNAPFLTVIGLYSNVPEGGRIDDEQYAWFVNELGTAPADKALVVCLHHPPFSADMHHSGSQRMGEILDRAFQESGRIADAVFSGHVHNYQRFTRHVSGRQIPYVVAGAGGYWHLHYMTKGPDGAGLPVPMKMPDADVTLESFCDNRHSFLRLMATPRFLTCECWGVPRPQESWRGGAQRLDGFALDLQTHQLVKPR